MTVKKKKRHLSTLDSVISIYSVSKLVLNPLKKNSPAENSFSSYITLGLKSHSFSE